MQGLPRSLRDHVEGVSAACRHLARRYGCDEEKAAFVGLIHDVARAMSPQELLDQAQSRGIPVGKAERAAPVLLHAPVGAALLQRDWGIEDPEVLEAVACHTTGREGMTLLDKVLFLADKLEEGKEGYYAGLERVRELAEKDLDLALLEFFNWQVRRLVERNALLHPQAIAARNELLLTLGLAAASS